MPYARRTLLTGLLAALLVVAGLLLFDVLGTVFFAITVVSVLIPVEERFVDRGISPWWASALTSALVTMLVVAFVAVVVTVIYARVDAIVQFLSTLPSEISLSVFGFSYAVDVAVLFDLARGSLADVAVAVAGVLPVLAVKLTLFGILVFGLLMRHREAQAAVMAAVPSRHRDVVVALQRRAASTLFTLYVLQAVTALGTFAFAIPVFFALGYGYPVTLAFVAGVLQFLPIIGPSVLIGLLALYEISVGNVGAAVAVLVVAGFFVAWLPDVLIRPRFSRERAQLPGTLYFIGFTGGLLTIGPVGIIAGPLVVALVVEAAGLLAVEGGASL